MVETGSWPWFAGLVFSLTLGVARAALLPDSGFGTSGTSLVRVGTESDEARAVRIDSSGRAVIAGNPYVSNGPPSIGVVRLGSDGSPDPAFGINGRAVVAVGGAGATSSANALAFQADGKILVAGNLTIAGASRPNMFFIRLMVDGGIDNTFDGDGVLMVPLPANNNASWANAVGVQSTGRILIAGARSPGGLFMVGLQGDGSVDSAFGVGGYIERLDNASEYQSLAFQSDGKILASALILNPSRLVPPPDLILMRFSADGATDSTFGAAGVVRINVGNLAVANRPDPTHDLLWAVAPRPDGRIVLAGQVITNFDAFVGVNSNGFVAQLLDSGALDTQFGRNGYVRLPDVDGNDRARDVVLLPGGDLVVGSDKRLAQISADGQVVSYTADPYDTGSIAAQPDGKVIIVPAEPVIFSSRFMMRRFSTSTLPPLDNDTVPDPFLLGEATTTLFGSPVVSQRVTITGLSAPATLSVSAGGDFSIGCVEDYPGFTQTITNFSTICVRHWSGSEASPIVQTALTIGGVSSVFTSNAGDGIPNQFQFVDLVGVTPGTYAVSAPVTIMGITSSPNVGISQGPGEISIGCNGVWLGGGRISNGQTLCVRHMTPGSSATTTTTRVRIGGISGDFSSTTRAASGGGGSSGGGVSGGGGGGL